MSAIKPKEPTTQQQWCVVGLFFQFARLTFPAIFVVTGAEEHTQNVWAVRLRDCHLGYHANIHAVALACPGVDYLKVWSLPVEQPWQQTPARLPDPWLGWYARR